MRLKRSCAAKPRTSPPAPRLTILPKACAPFSKSAALPLLVEGPGRSACPSNAGQQRSRPADGSILVWRSARIQRARNSALSDTLLTGGLGLFVRAPAVAGGGFDAERARTRRYRDRTVGVDVFSPNRRRLWRGVADGAAGRRAECRRDYGAGPRRS